MSNLSNAFAPAPLTSHLAGEHHGGHGSSFIDHLLSGFAWRTGGDAANFLFHLAPALITAVVLIILVVVGVRWLRNRSRS